MVTKNIEIELPLYMQATVEDYEILDLSVVLDDVQDAELFNIETILMDASKVAVDKKDLPTARVFAALSGVASFHFTAEKDNDPFCAMMVMNGRRTPIPDDYLGASIDGLESIALNIKNLPLRARVCDVVWMLKRANHECGRCAAQTYHELVLEVRNKGLTLQHSDDRELSRRCIEFLRRSLIICRKLGNASDLRNGLITTITEFRESAMTKKKSSSLLMLSELCLEFQLIDTTIVAQELEVALKWENDLSFQAKFWSLASTAYHDSKDEDNKWRCLVECAESFFKHSEKFDMAMLKSHWISSALAAYQGIPNQKERRTELRHMLVDEQVHINEEMSEFSLPIDLTELVKNTKERFAGEESFQMLGKLASLHHSEEPAKLIEEANKQIQAHPLSSSFGKSQHDSEGKVIHKTSGGHIGERADENIANKISENQALLRSIVVASAINPALFSISRENFPSLSDIETICLNSPFIPTDRQEAYFEGIRSFLFGCHLVAFNIFVPQMENSIRHVLKNNDFDPTSFDTATQIQEDRALTSIYSDMRTEMETCFGVPITFEIENLFLKKSGPNLRNAAAHGLLSDGAMAGANAVYANWFIFRLCCLPLLRNWSDFKPH